MTDRVIPLVDARRAMPLPDVGRWDAAAGRVVDTLARPLHDLRISVTDRCNFRCTYCMPKEVFGRDYRFLPRRELLTFEEIERVSAVFVGLGVESDGWGAAVLVAGVFCGSALWWSLLSGGVGFFRGTLERHTIWINRLAALVIIAFALVILI